MWVPFWRSFPGHEARRLLSGGSKWGGLGGGQKVYVEKVYVLFLPPLRIEIGTRNIGFSAQEAQQRYSSYRTILEAIGWRNSFMLVFMWYRTIIARSVAKWGIAQICLSETMCHGEVSHDFGWVLTPLKKVSREMGYRCDSIAISRDMGPLSGTIPG